MIENPKVSILLRNLNEVENLKILFKLFNLQTYDNFEVVFLDSGSVDGSVKFVENFESKFKISINHIKKSDFTFGRALNKCLDYSNSPKYVISLSAHCFPLKEDFIENYVQLFKKSKAKIIYGKQSGYKYSKLSEASHLNSWFGNNYGKQINHPFTNNGNCGYDIEVFDMFKFNEELTGCEDIEIAYRLLQNDGEIIYGKGIEVHHYHTENFKNIYNRYLRESIALNRIFPYRFTKRQFILSFFRQVFKDIRFKLQNKEFNSRNLSSILSYRLVKNYAHLRGFGERTISWDDIYNYSEVIKLTKNLYKHYLE